MKKILLALSLLPLIACNNTQVATPERPPITGVAHAAIYCSDVDATRDFIMDYFGFDESIKYENADGSTKLSALKINERQIIELFPEKEAGSDRLLHYAIETTDCEGMRRYLESKGYDVPEEATKIDMGIINFFMTDPTGHLLEFVEYTGDGDFGRTRGKHMPATRISNRMNHLGFYAPDAKVAKEFFGDVLGFNTEWETTVEDLDIDVALMRVPEGEDAIELIFSDKTPTAEDLLFDNHISLEVISLPDALDRLSERKLPEGVPAPGAPSVTKTGKAAINFSLQDGTRLELME